MILIAKPKLKIVDENELHMSRRPGCTAWLLLGLSAIIFITISSCLISDVSFLIILLLTEIMFDLDSLGKWEDLVLYKRKNKAIVVKSIWSDKLCSMDGEVFSTKLTDILHIGITSDMGLFIHHGAGKTITLNMKGLTREETQYLKNEINYFLNMSRLVHLDYSLINPSNRLFLTSDSEEDLQNLALKTGLPKSNELTVSDIVLGSSKIIHYPTQQNLSSPGLIHGAQFNRYQLMSLRRGPYTENTTYLDCLRCTRNFCVASMRRNLLKFKEHT